LAIFNGIITPQRPDRVVPSPRGRRAAGIHRLIWTLPSKDMPITSPGNALEVRVAGAIA
jgi:hypothetical protein